MKNRNKGSKGNLRKNRICQITLIREITKPVFVYFPGIQAPDPST